MILVTSFPETPPCTFLICFWRLSLLAYERSQPTWAHLSGVCVWAWFSRAFLSANCNRHPGNLHTNPWCTRGRCFWRPGRLRKLELQGATGQEILLGGLPEWSRRTWPSMELLWAKDSGQSGWVQGYRLFFGMMVRNEDEAWSALEGGQLSERESVATQWDGNRQWWEDGGGVEAKYVSKSVRNEGDEHPSH